ncbi:unnamed protein product [Arctogadus glacialis]
MGRSATETIRLRTGSSECHSTVHSTAEAEGPARGPSIAPTVWTRRGRPSTEPDNLVNRNWCMEETKPP